MSKYKPLSDRLSGHQLPQWRASFAELEEVLGFPLPKGARTGRAWWGDDKRSWREQGWRADDIDHDGGYVTFTRDGQTTAAVAEDIVMPPGASDPSEPFTEEPPAMHGATSPPLPPSRKRPGMPALAAGVAVLAGVAALVARKVMKRRSA